MASKKEQAAKVKQAIKRFESFTGMNVEYIDQVEVQPIDDVMLTMGKCTGIMYSTVRDGVQEKYLHQFKKSAQPLLCVSSDGLQLYLIGGSYSVTDKGIEDV